MNQPKWKVTLANRLRRRVARGAALLDAKRPGWAESVDLDALDMSSGARCVLGQMFSDYYSGLLRLNLVDDNNPALSHEFSHGFCLSDRDEKLAVVGVASGNFDRKWRRRRMAWAVLGDLWAVQITKRRQKARAAR